MKILFITQWFDPEPGAIRGLPLARYLQSKGHEVQVLTGFPNYPGGKIYEGYRQAFSFREEMEGVPILRVPLYPSHSSSSLGRILNYVSFALSASIIGLPQLGSFDVAYVYHPPPTVGLPGMLYRLFTGTPFVYHIADMWPESVLESGMAGSSQTKRILEKAIHAWCNLVYRKASKITVLSPGFKQLLIERGVPEEKIEIIYNWTEDDLFLPLEPNSALAEKLCIDGEVNIVYAGNMGAFQGLDTVIRAAGKVKHEKRIKISLVGTGQKEAELKQLAKDTGAENVHFVSRRDYREMPQIYALADALIVHLKNLPFFATTIPSKTQVTLACGKPVLMAVAGDAAELVEQADAGIVCAPEDADGLANAMLQFANMDSAERKRLGDNARRYYLEQMSLEKGGESMESLLKKVANL